MPPACGEGDQHAGQGRVAPLGRRLDQACSRGREPWRPLVPHLKDRKNEAAKYGGLSASRARSARGANALGVFCKPIQNGRHVLGIELRAADSPNLGCETLGAADLHNLPLQSAGSERAAIKLSTLSQGNALHVSLGYQAAQNSQASIDMTHGVNMGPDSASCHKCLSEEFLNHMNHL
jgi:hypothetical protein